MSTKLGWRIISTYFLLLIIGLFTIYNVLNASYIDRELENRKTPLVEHSQQIAKEIEALIDLEDPGPKWSEIVSEFFSTRSNIRYLILGSDDRVIIDSYKFKKKGQVLELELVDKLRAEKEIQSRLYQSSQGEELLYTAYPVYDKQADDIASIVALTSVDGFRDEINLLLKKLIYIGSGFILFSLIFYFYVLQDVFSPLDKLDQGVIAMSRGNYSYKLEEEGNEFSTMVRSFNTLGSRLADIESQQKEFVSTLSHELKTPIASMKIITDSLVQAKGNVPSDVLYDFLEDINSESDRLKDIIDDMLFMATLERQDVSLNLDIRPITKALEESIRVLEPLAEKSNIQIHKEFQDKFFVEFDYNKMKQVFINVIGNAVKYSDEGGHVYIRVNGDKDSIYLEIEDTGIGIAEEELPFIFDRLYRVERARSRERGGSGLGLHIVQQIVHLHNGQINMTSILDQGSTVHIKLPRVYEV